MSRGGGLLNEEELQPMFIADLRTLKASWRKTICTGSAKRINVQQAGWKSRLMDVKILGRQMTTSFAQFSA
jgi:hypothetical protein